MKRLSQYMLLALVLASGVSGAFAQTSQGTLSGAARDPQGAMLPGAKVTITNEGTGETRTSMTKSDGTYRIESVPPGRYTLAITETGFETKKVTGVVINPSIVSSYDAVLAVGKINDVVGVKATTNAINT